MAKPRIVIDGYNLSLEQGTGVATYARNLSFALRDLGAEVGVLYGNSTSSRHANPVMREITFFDRPMRTSSRLSQRLRDFQRILTLPFGEIAFEVPVTGQVIRDSFQSRLPHFDHVWNVKDLFIKQSLYGGFFGRQMTVHFQVPPDIVHWTYPLALRVPKATNIYTLHDLVPLRLPYTTLDIKSHYYGLIRRLTKNADHIVTVSEASKRDIVNLFGISEERITNTYQAVHIPDIHRNRTISDIENDLKGTFGLNYKKYFLFFGAVEPKKNVGRLIEAYLASGVVDPLVILGKKAWQADQELQLISREANFQGVISRNRDMAGPSHILRFEYASFPLLVSLIRGAKAVLFPSLYEGFGLPALEAMSLGTPVLTSNTASMPEVVADAALQIDPYDTRALAAGIRALDGDADLRGRLAEAGPIRAQAFSPERYRERLAKLYAKFTDIPK